mmetsp:Transcript_122558/g.392216  ORF Transcript_122558/g.392216 Transcript_122558/m.392216 type:complete len:274 (+) Transcript_122558:3423-4244(+)
MRMQLVEQELEGQRPQQLLNPLDEDAGLPNALVVDSCQANGQELASRTLEVPAELLRHQAHALGCLGGHGEVALGLDEPGERGHQRIDALGGRQLRRVLHDGGELLQVHLLLLPLFHSENLLDAPTFRQLLGDIKSLRQRELVHGLGLNCNTACSHRKFLRAVVALRLAPDLLLDGHGLEALDDLLLLRILEGFRGVGLLPEPARKLDEHAVASLLDSSIGVAQTLGGEVHVTQLGSHLEGAKLVEQLLKELDDDSDLLLVETSHLLLGILQV